MSAEAAVADSDGVLGAEPSGDEGVGHAMDDERRGPPGWAEGPEQPDAIDVCEPVAEPAGYVVVVGPDHVPSQPGQLVDGGVEGDGPENVR